MPTVRLSRALADEYQSLFDTIEYTSNERLIDLMAEGVHRSLNRYEVVALARHVPPVFVGLVHLMESGGNFNRHLHNGDPLTARTVHVPKGRPVKGTPPFTWEESAADALRGPRYWDDQPRSIPRLLWWLERFNGWGYRLYHPETLSPYLWAGCQHYTRGKYAADGHFSETLRSKQIGAAVIFRRFLEKYPETAPDWAMNARSISVPGEGMAGSWRYRSIHTEDIKALQTAMNRAKGIFVKADGFAGPMTSEAFRKLTGRYLMGDPRAS